VRQLQLPERHSLSLKVSLKEFHLPHQEVVDRQLCFHHRSQIHLMSGRLLFVDPTRLATWMRPEVICAPSATWDSHGKLTLIVARVEVYLQVFTSGQKDPGCQTKKKSVRTQHLISSWLNRAVTGTQFLSHKVDLDQSLSELHEP